MEDAFGSKRKHRVCMTEEVPVTKVPALGTLHQIHGGSKITTMAETRKRANGHIDFLPEHGFDGQQLIPRIPNIIVAEEIWPRIREGNHLTQVQHMLNMRLVSHFWCAFVDRSELMDRHQSLKYKKVGPWRFKYAPGRFAVFARFLEG